VSALRPAFLDDVPSAQSRKGEAHARDSFVTIIDVTNRDNAGCTHLIRYCSDDEIEIQDEIDDEDDDEDEDVDDEDDDDDEDEDEDEEDVETWQVSDSGASR
jgi:hypothetical protein